jgi:hypothetical protein
MKLWNVGASRERDTKLALMTGFLVVLCDPLANLRRSHPNNRVRRRIILGVSSEDFNTQSSFFHRIRLTGKRTPHHEAQEHREAAAVTEVWILQEALNLFLDRSFLEFTKISRIR